MKGWNATKSARLDFMSSCPSSLRMLCYFLQILLLSEVQWNSTQFLSESYVKYVFIYQQVLHSVYTNCYMFLLSFPANIRESIIVGNKQHVVTPRCGHSTESSRCGHSTESPCCGQGTVTTLWTQHGVTTLWTQYGVTTLWTRYGVTTLWTQHGVTTIRPNTGDHSLASRPHNIRSDWQQMFLHRITFYTFIHFIL
jgi:hypothetical protein